MKCPKCGTEFDSKFCPECGFDASSDKEINNQNPIAGSDTQNGTSEEIEEPKTDLIEANQSQCNEENKHQQYEYQYDSATGDQEKEKFYKKTWFVVLLLIFIPPAGIVLMWLSRKPKGKTARIVLSVVFALYTIFWLTGVIDGPSDSAKNDTAKKESVSVESTPEKEKKLVSISAKYSGSREAGTAIDSTNSGISVTGTYDDESVHGLDGWTVEPPSQLVAEQTTDYTITYEGKTCTLSIECSTISPESYKAQCQDISYDELARNPDSYSGQFVKFTGKVIQVLEDGNSANYRINVTQGEYGIWDNTVFVVFEYEDGQSRFLEDDIVTFYGMYGGLYTYQSTLGGNITIPSVYAEYVDLN